jgi:predicted ABC-class ATPase
MAEERSNDLEERRDELTRSLPELSRQRAETYRVNSDALALGRAGVKREQPEEMTRLRDAEAAADSAIRDVQRELREIDGAIDRRPRAGLGSRFRRAVRL